MNEENSFSDSQLWIILYVRLATSSLSLVGSIFIVLSILFVTKSLRKSRISRLVFSLSISSCGTAVVNLLSFKIGINGDESRLCVYQSFFMQFFQQSEFLWNCMIAVHLFILIVISKNIPHDSFMHKCEIAYHSITWSVSLISAILPLLTNSYGDAGAWCWIKNDEIGIMWRFGVFYLPLFLYLALIGFLYTWILRKMYKVFRGVQKDEREKQRELRYLYKMAAYPIVFFVLWIFPLINRIQNAFSSKEFLLLYILQAFTAPLVGLSNSIVYGFNSQLRQSYTNLFQRFKYQSVPIEPVDRNM